MQKAQNMKFQSWNDDDRYTVDRLTGEITNLCVDETEVNPRGIRRYVTMKGMQAKHIDWTGSVLNYNLGFVQ